MADVQPPEPETEGQVGYVLVSDELLAFGPLTLFEGYRRAVGRYLAAADEQGASATETYIPLFEALHWAVSLRDLLGKRERPLRERLGSALGYARDRVHHDWAAALEPHQIPVEATAGSLTLSGKTVEWFWKPMERLPPPSGGRRSDEKAYRELLSGQPARAALIDLRELFRRHQADGRDQSPVAMDRRSI